MNKISSVCNSSKQWLDLVQNTATNVMTALAIPGFSRTSQYQDLRQANHANHPQQSQTEKTVTGEQLNFWIEHGKLSTEQKSPHYLYGNEATAKKIRNFIANLISALNRPTDQGSLTLMNTNLPLALKQIEDIIAGNDSFPGFIPIPPRSPRTIFFPLRDLRNKYSMGLIDMAVCRGYTEAIRALLAMGICVDQRMPNGATLVHTAVNVEQTETIKTLKELGANVDEPDNDRATPLFYAAKNNQDGVIIRYLAEWGANVKARDKNGATPLHIAASNGKIETIKTLIALGINVNETDNNNATPLFYAAKNDQAKAIITLKQLDANINIPNIKDMTPVFIAAQHDNANAIRELEKLGADIHQPNIDGMTPVFIAAQHDSANAIRELEKLGADIHQPNIDGMTPVFIAAQHDSTNAIRELKMLGADIHQPNIDGMTPVFIAAQNNKVNALRALKALGADIHQPNIHGKTPISIAKEKGFTRIARHLSKEVSPEQFTLWVKEGRLSKMDTKLAHPHKNQKTARKLREFIRNRIEAFSYSIADRDAPPALIGMDLPLALQQIAHMIAGDHQVPGFTPLNASCSFTLEMRDRQSRDLFHFAIYHNHLEAIKVLIALGADANQWFSDGKSPLHLAAFNGQIDAIRTLVVPRGAYIDIRNNKGITPLFLAAQNGHIAAIHTLLDLGANSNSQMHDNETPVFFAARFGHSDAIAILKKRGALINARMTDDTSPIFFAAHNGHTDAVRTLMDLGADYRSPNRDKITPLGVAEKRGYPEIVRLLSKP